MQNRIHFPRAISVNRLKLAFGAIGLFIVVVAGLYYYMSFKKSHIPQTIEGTWICQEYLDSIAAKKSVAQVLKAPMFVQMSFKKSWVDSVVCTGFTSTYVLQLKKQSKGKYLLIRYSDTLGTIKIKHKFVYTERWNDSQWSYVKIDTSFKRLDKGNIFRKRLNKILLAGSYTPLEGKGMQNEVTFSDSGTIKGIRGISIYKICYSADCYYNTAPKDAVFIGNKESAYKYAFDVKGDTLSIYTMHATDSTMQFKPYWRFLRNKAATEPHQKAAQQK